MSNSEPAVSAREQSKVVTRGLPDMGSLRVGLAAVLLTLGVGAVVDFSTDTYALGPFYGLAPATQARMAWCAAAIVACGLGLALITKQLRLPLVGHAALRLLPGVAALGTFFWTAPLISERNANLWDGFVALSLLGFAGLSALVWTRVSPWWVPFFALVVGTTVRVVHFDTFPFTFGADMLPLVVSGVDALLAGRSPYNWYNLPAPLPLTYYPITVLSYLPARALHFDPRWTNIAGELSVAAALLWARRGHRGRAVTDSASSVDAALLTWSIIYLLPSSIYFDRITTAPVAWAALAWLLALLSSGSRRAWIALGLAAATTPLTSVCVPFALLSIWQQRGLRQAALEGLGAAAIAMVLILPWYLWSPQAFVDGTILWFNDLSRFPGTNWVCCRTWARYVGFGGLFWSSGLERWLRPMQAACVAILTGLYVVRGARPWQIAGYFAAAFALFMAFNSVHWPYFFQPVIVAGLVAISVSRTTDRGATESLPYET